MPIIRGINLFEKQEDIIKQILNTKKRYITLCASRQFSKSTILENILMYRSLNETKTNSLYVTPTYSLSKIVMTNLYNNLFETNVIKTYNKTDNIIEFINGSIINFRSGTNPDTIRGLSINYLFIDEAAFQQDEVWNVSRPTMNVIGKQAILVSTPRGKQGFFYSMCQQGLAGNENYLYLFGHYNDNPFYNHLEVEDAKLTLPTNIFRQEYEAEFIDDGGSVFQNIKLCETITNFKGQRNETPYSIGIDLGRQNDYTVLTVLNNKNEVVEIYRVNKQDWTTIVSGINNIIKKYPGPSILCETNGIGDVVFDLLKKTNGNIKPFTTTNETKNEIIEELILAFQEGKIHIPTSELFPPLESELNTYTFQYSSKTRKITYNAMVGFNDDCVISLALALKAKKRTGDFKYIII